MSVQDAAAQRAAPLLLGARRCRRGARVLDACAAPGGKTAHLLELADLDVLALDRDAQRLARVQRHAGPARPAGATLRAADAGDPAAWWDGRPFDAILLDAPCSASGIVRRHPDVRWLRRADDIAALARTAGAAARRAVAAARARRAAALLHLLGLQGRGPGTRSTLFCNATARRRPRCDPASPGPPAAAARQCDRSRRRPTPSARRLLLRPDRKTCTAEPRLPCAAAHARSQAPRAARPRVRCALWLRRCWLLALPALARSGRRSRSSCVSFEVSAATTACRSSFAAALRAAAQRRRRAAARRAAVLRGRGRRCSAAAGTGATSASRTCSRSWRVAYQPLTVDLARQPRRPEPELSTRWPRRWPRCARSVALEASPSRRSSKPTAATTSSSASGSTPRQLPRPMQIGIGGAGRLGARAVERTHARRTDAHPASRCALATAPRIMTKASALGLDRLAGGGHRRRRWCWPSCCR